MNDKRQTLGTAIIGTGFMAWVHLETLRRLAIPVAGVLGSSPEKTRAFAADQGIDPFASYAEVLSAAAVDTVHVTTPNNSHFELVRAALLAGKHVLCEKPLAMTTDQTLQLVQLAADHPEQRTAVNYNIRFYPLCVEMRQRVRRGDLGRIFHATGSYVQDWLLHETDYNWRVLADRGGALRAVADIGTHWLDLVQWIIGQQVVSVCADLQTAHRVRQRPLGEIDTYSATAQDQPRREVEIDTDDAASVLLRFSGGIRGCVSVSQVTAGRKNCLRLELAGSTAAAAWDSQSPCELWLGHRDRPNQILPRDPALLDPVAAQVAAYPGGHDEGYDDSFKQAFLAFYSQRSERIGKISERSQTDGKAAGDDAHSSTVLPKIASFSDGHREVAICEAILKSHHQRTWIDVQAE